MRPTPDDLNDGVKLLRHIANGGLLRSQFPVACAKALLLRIEQLEVELRKYTPDLPTILGPSNEPAPQGCYCPPGKCFAPKIMGRQMPCLRQQQPASAEPK